MGDAVRVKALQAISWLVSMKKKAIQKMKLIQPILDVVFSLMCRGADEEEEDLEDSEETEKAASYAARVSSERRVVRT